MAKKDFFSENTAISDFISVPTKKEENKKSFEEKREVKEVSIDEEVRPTAYNVKIERNINPDPENYKLNYEYVEKKSRRVQLLLKKSVYEKAKNRAEKLGISVNDYINRVLEEI